PGSAFGEQGEGFVRMTIAASEEDVEAGFRKIVEWAEQQKRGNDRKYNFDHSSEEDAMSALLKNEWTIFGAALTASIVTAVLTFARASSVIVFLISALALAVLDMVVG